MSKIYEIRNEKDDSLNYNKRLNDMKQEQGWHKKTNAASNSTLNTE
jgi:hypothetical protein